MKWLTKFFKSPTQREIINKPTPVPFEMTLLDPPQSFGYKCNWLAVSTTDTDRLAEVIDIRERKACNWEYGIHSANSGKFFVSPPVHGWSFVVSKGLPYMENDSSITVLKKLLVALSQEFGEAQYFGTYRVVGYDGWMKAAHGIIERAYAIVDGGNTIVEGEWTPAEQKYRLINTFSVESETDPDYFDTHECADQSMTMAIAGTWGINPQDLEGRSEVSSRLGWVGEWR